MLRYLLLLTCSFACSTPKNTFNITLIKGGPLNERIELGEPAPYELKAAAMAVEMERRPHIKYLSMQRAVAAFKEGKTELLVFGQAEEIPVELQDKSIHIQKSKASLVMLKKSSLQNPSDSAALIRQKIRLGLMRNSTHAAYFVKNINQNELQFYNSFQKAVEALENNLIDALLVDSLAAERLVEKNTSMSFCELDLPAGDIRWIRK